MTKFFTTAAAMAVLATTLAAPASAQSLNKFCAILADDAAYIMGVRQRGEPMVSVLDALDWRKYEGTQVEELVVGIAGWAWEEPIYPSANGRQIAVAQFAKDTHAACIAARR